MYVTDQERELTKAALAAQPALVSDTLLDEIERLRGQVAYYKGLHDAFLDRSRASALLQGCYKYLPVDSWMQEQLKNYLTECGIQVE